MKSTMGKFPFLDYFQIELSYVIILIQLNNVYGYIPNMCSLRVDFSLVEKELCAHLLGLWKTFSSDFFKHFLFLWA